MKAFLKWLALAPLMVVLLVFAVVNRRDVTILFDPFGSVNSAMHVTTPLFLALFATLAVGVLLGGIVAWIGAGPRRRADRETRTELTRLRAELDRQRITPQLGSSERRTAA